MLRAFSTRGGEYAIGKGVRGEIDDNFSGRVRGAFRDRGKVLRGLNSGKPGQGFWV